MDYETLAANLRRLVAEGADVQEIQKAANAVASAESARGFHADEQSRKEERQSGRERIIRDGDRLKDTPSLWSEDGLGDHLKSYYFDDWRDIAEEACRIGGIEAGSPMSMLVKAVAAAAAEGAREDY